MFIQIIVVIFILFVISRIFLKFKEQDITIMEFILWGILWLAVGVIVLLPRTTSWLAKLLGVGRGVDAIIYLALIALFYGVFRIYVKLEHIEHEITKIVREIALKSDHNSKK